MLLSGAAGLSSFIPDSVQKALAIDPAPGSTFMDAEHIVILMQENRSFDHCFGTLQGVRGFNDPRAITLPNNKPVWFQTNDKGETYAPFRLDIKDTKSTWMGDLPHTRESQVDAHNAGKYDKWLQAKKSGTKKYSEMPLTMGHYTRADLPFNFGMADAFTVCDQNFCSAMTSTTPNRSFFWTGKITNVENDIPKANIRNEDYDYCKMKWETFPELLTDNDISWKFYQNGLDCGGGFKGEEREWLSNFGCNPLEYFAVYNVKFAPYYIQNLQILANELPDKINNLQKETPASEEAAKKIQKEITKKQEALNNALEELEKWNEAVFEKLSDKEKQLYYNAFVVNDKDSEYRHVTQLKYNDGTKERMVTVPAGDILHQFRMDVNDGKLPTVSWFASPQNFSDHPSAPWYGAWYVSEVLDILTKNPEVWKKTILILTYDENDGYYDHVPPFSIADKNKPETGKCSNGIDTEIEHVRFEYEVKHGISAKHAREAPIGLGFRVPMIIASPWSRGGKVCSEVFDHTSTLQFLETFLNKKFNKNIHVENISQWRRTICGDISSTFCPYHGGSVQKLPFLHRDEFVEDIYNAKFKEIPAGYKRISDIEIEQAVKKSELSELMSAQESGTRIATALSYELYADAQLSEDGKNIEIKLTAGNKVFGKHSCGSPFTVYAPAAFIDDAGKTEHAKNWSFAVVPGDSISYQWRVAAFESGKYHLRVYGPNGFYREFKGDEKDPMLDVACAYESSVKKKLSGNVLLKLTNKKPQQPLQIIIIDNAYKNKPIKRTISKSAAETIILNLAKSSGWYDFTLKVSGAESFEKRFAGRVETGKESITDPYMGRMV